MFLQIYNVIQLHSSHCSNHWIWNTFIFCCHSILSFSLQPVCVQVNLRRYNMQSFSVGVGSRGYHVYRGNNRTSLVINQPIQVSIEINAISKANDPYCCKITITRLDRIGAVTVGHIPRGLSITFCRKVVLSQVLLPVYSIECQLYQKGIGNTNNQNDVQSHF